MCAEEPWFDSVVASWEVVVLGQLKWEAQMALPAEPLRAPSAVAVCALALPARAKVVTIHTSQRPKNPPPHDTGKLWTGASGVRQNGF